MKTWTKITIAIVGSGINGGLAFASGLYPEWSMVFSSAVLVVSGTMSKLIGFPAMTIEETEA